MVKGAFAACFGRLSISYRREEVDAGLERCRALMTGRVLDVGGKRPRRGLFVPPATGAWWVLNIARDTNPDLLASAEAMPLRAGSLDTILCTEVMEHVLFPDRVMAECARLLKPGGALILTTPFHYRYHGDPYDFQRLTDNRLKWLAERAGLAVERVEPQGLYFTVLGDMVKHVVSEIRWTLIRIPLGAFFLPILTLLRRLDATSWVRGSDSMKRYTTGYLLIARKP